VTSQDLIVVLREEVLRRLQPLVIPGSNTKQVAQEIAWGVRETLSRLDQMGYLPVALPPPKEILVDFNPMLSTPPYQVTLRW
jgi:hypothetical protein